MLYPSKRKVYVEYQPSDPNSHARSLNHANMLRKNTNYFLPFKSFRGTAQRIKNYAFLFYTLQSGQTGDSGTKLRCLFTLRFCQPILTVNFTCIWRCDCREKENWKISFSLFRGGGICLYDSEERTETLKIERNMVLNRTKSFHIHSGWNTTPKRII